MSEDDKAYFYRRAEEEIARAQSSADGKIVSFHYHLAGFYLDLVFGGGADAAGATEASAMSGAA